MGHKSLKDIWFDVDEAKAVLDQRGTYALAAVNAPMHSFDWAAIMTRAIEAGNLDAEIPAIIADMRAENLRRGGDDRTFGLGICGLIATISLPVVKTGANPQ